MSFDPALIIALQRGHAAVRRELGRELVPAEAREVTGAPRGRGARTVDFRLTAARPARVSRRAAR
jgi:hypothetical protein